MLRIRSTPGVSRRHFRLRIDQLETLVEEAEGVPAIEAVVALDGIAEELTHRTTARARNLSSLVAMRLCAIRHRGPIFRDPDLEERPDSTISYLDEYRSRRRHFRYGGGDATYPDASHRVLDIKAGKALAIFETAARVVELVSNEVTLTAVPSSNPANTSSGIVRVARLVALANKGTDATSAVVRTERRQPSHFGGDRSISGHLSTLAVTTPEVIANRSVLLIDDVTTTGNSLRACRQVLLDAGAHCVKMFAIAQTSR